jgi:hypothetical protein
MSSCRMLARGNKASGRERFHSDTVLTDRLIGQIHHGTLSKLFDMIAVSQTSQDQFPILLLDGKIEQSALQLTEDRLLERCVEKATSCLIFPPSHSNLLLL